jgi:hypothetical protein
VDPFDGGPQSSPALHEERGLGAATELSIQLSAFGSALLWGRLQTVMSWFDQKPRW